MSANKTVYDFECVDLQNQPLPLRQFKGKPLLIVNTASLCGFSSQYKGIEDVWQHFKNEGLMVIGAPSNDFGKQEPGNNPTIASLCSVKFGVTFPLLSKGPVRSPGATPLFQWIAEEAGCWGRPRWNFYKYLIGRDGHLKTWFSCLTKPESPRFRQAIADLVRPT